MSQVALREFTWAHLLFLIHKRRKHDTSPLPLCALGRSAVCHKQVGAEPESWGARAGEAMTLEEPGVTRRGISRDKPLTGNWAGTLRCELQEAEQGWDEATEQKQGVGPHPTGGGGISSVFLAPWPSGHGAWPGGTANEVESSQASCYNRAAELSTQPRTHCVRHISASFWVCSLHCSLRAPHTMHPE